MEKEHTYHIIRDGVKEEVTASQLEALQESNEKIEGDMEWYLSHGYDTLDDVREKIEAKRSEFHPNSNTTLQDALAKGHMLLEDFDRQLRNDSNE